MCTLEQGGLRPGNVVWITPLPVDHRFLAKILYIVIDSEAQIIDNVFLPNWYSDERDGIYYSVAYYNHAEKKIVSSSDYINSVEFFPLDTYGKDWITYPYDGPGKV
jgi:hypothetical protein